MRSLSRPFAALFLLGAFPLFTPPAFADILTVASPVYLNGSGTFSTYDRDLDGETPGVSFYASGSNGTDSVSIGGDVESFFSSSPTVGSGFGFEGGQQSCLNGTETDYYTCRATIDGISGDAVFGFNGDAGFIEVYEAEGWGAFSSVGPLMAQAYVDTNIVITSVNDLGGPNDPTASFDASFVMSAPDPAPDPPTAPEIRTGFMALIGLFGMAVFRRKSRVARP